MIEEIKKELLNCDVEILYGKFGEEYKYLKHSDVVKLLDKYKDKEIKFDDGSSKYAVVKVPVVQIKNKYKKAWEELREDNQLPVPFIELLSELMQNLEEKYNLDNKQVSIVERVDE